VGVSGVFVGVNVNVGGTPVVVGVNGVKVAVGVMGVWVAVGGTGVIVQVAVNVWVGPAMVIWRVTNELPPGPVTVKKTL